MSLYKPPCKVFIEYLNSSDRLRLEPETNTFHTKAVDSNCCWKFFLGKNAPKGEAYYSSPLPEDPKYKLSYKSPIESTIWELDLKKAANNIKRKGYW